LYNICYCR